MLKIVNQVTEEECGIIRKRRPAQLTAKGNTTDKLLYVPGTAAFCLQR